jgi:hypothetical protein
MPRGHKGESKTPGSGRKKGTPNKDKLPLQQKAEELGVDPFQILLLFAKGDVAALGIEVITADQRLRAASEACQYLYPKRKAIQVDQDTDPNSDRPLQHLSDEELDAL